MDKTTLVNLVQSADVGEALKIEILALINADNPYNQETIKKVQAKLDAIASNIMDEVTDLQIQAAADKLNSEMEKIHQDTKALNMQINTKADALDLQQARSQLS